MMPQPASKLAQFLGSGMGLTALRLSIPLRSSCSRLQETPSAFNLLFFFSAQRKKLRDASYDDIEMGIDISLVFFNTTYP